MKINRSLKNELIKGLLSSSIVIFFAWAFLFQNNKIIFQDQRLLALHTDGGSCSSGADCISNYCVNYMCVGDCSTGANCPLSNYCVNHFCTGNCASDADCSGGKYKCVNHSCTTLCATDACCYESECAPQTCYSTCTNEYSWSLCSAHVDYSTGSCSRTGVNCIGSVY